MRAMSLPHTLMSYKVSQLTQARIIDPKAVKNKLTRFGKKCGLRCDSIGSARSFSVSSLD